LFDQLADPQFWQQVREAAMIPAWLLGFVAILLGSVCWIAVHFCAKPGSVPEVSSIRITPQTTPDDLLKPNRWNVILYGDFLTPRGLFLRRCAFVALAIFAVCFVTMLLLASLAPRP
jgi:hypothetical protein